MNSLEWRVTSSLAAIYAVRMLGLFMVLPVFAIYAADHIADSTKELIGFAIGVYGFTQAAFQFPVGTLSDKIGRKPVIIGGLLLFALGSVVAALSTSIWGIIAGRAIQGMGAVAGPTLALAADLTREENRTRIMAFIGMTIAMSFIGGMVLGPVVSNFHNIGLPGVFWVITGLALIGVLLVMFAVPTPEHSTKHRDTGIMREYMTQVLQNKALLRMNAGVFILHLVMTANFVVIPSILREVFNKPTDEHWQIYLPVFVLAFIISIPMIIVGEKKQKIRQLLLVSTGMLLISELLFGLGYTNTLLFFTAFFIFFIGFNYLEATQPSLVAKYSSVETKGTAMGLFSTSQFLGIFVGGSLGGIVNKLAGPSGLFLMCALITLIWLAVAFKLPPPSFYTSRVIRLNAARLNDLEALKNALLSLSGVKEVAIASDEQVAYLKVDKSTLDEAGLSAFTPTSA